MKAFVGVMLFAVASAQLPPMMSSYMPYGGMPIVTGPSVVNSSPMVSRPSMVSGPPMMSGSSMISGPTMLSGTPMMSGGSIVSGSVQPIDIHEDSCVLRCVRQCQNDQSSSSLSNLRTVGLSSYQPNQSGPSNSATSFNVGLDGNFQSGLSSETSRLTMAPSTKTSSSGGQIAVKG